MPRFSYRSEMPATPAEVFAWHDRPGAFQRLIPPWDRVRVIDGGGRLCEGGRVSVEVRWGPRTIRWDAILRRVEPGRGFEDVQLRGPFARWTHRHRFLDAAGGRCLLEDDVEYEVPGGAVGRFLGGELVRKQLARLFRYRHEVTRNDLQRLSRRGSDAPLRIAVTGSTGLIGTRLTALLRAAGHDVRPVVRRAADGERGEISWKPSAGKIDAAAFEGLDAVVHLSGANIGEARWTPARKAIIRSSRVRSTQLLARTLAGLEAPPRVLVCASAVGFYGDRGGEAVTEESGPGRGFLSSVCSAWEEAASPARDAGIRVVHVRNGIALSPAGGPLAKMLTPFRMGAGGVIGSGRQYMSWIALEELVGVIDHVIRRDALSGPVNAASPRPVTNREFTKVLGRVLGRPTVAPLPAFAVRALFGEMGEALLLEGVRVLPKKLEDSGYRFLYPDLESALRFELGRWPVQGPPVVSP